MNKRVLRLLEFDKIKLKLMDLASSQVGKNLVEELKPCSDADKIKMMQAETSESSGILMALGSVHMGPVHDIEQYVKLTAVGSYLYPGQLLQVCDTLRTGRLIKKTILSAHGDEETYPILAGVASSITVLKALEEIIENAIVSDEEVSDNASPELRKIRRSIETTHQNIRKKLDHIIHSQENQKYLQDTLVTIRQDRFVVPVKSEYKTAIKGLVHDQSGSGATLYIEPMAIVELNNQLKELKLHERDEIIRILTEISGHVGNATEAILANIEMLAQLDFVLAKGMLSIKLKGVASELNLDGKIHIRNGRHPLLDPKIVVPTTIWFGDQFHTLLITGPNTGGKTVTLKTMGLLCLMFQSGLHIPADFGTTLPVFDEVFADIGDEQSIEQSLSTFSSHMTNIVTILQDVTPNSLVLLDELGAGTDPTEGAALAMAILSRLHSMGTRTLATTHYNELKQFALTREGFENASVEFNVETLSPTYRLLIGVPGKSNAFEISSKLGLTEDVIEQARLFVHRESIQFEDVLTQIEESRKAAETDRDEALKLRLDVEKLKKRLEERADKTINQREKILGEAKEEARKVLKQAREESESIVRELRQFSSQIDKEGNRKIEEARRRLKGITNNVQEGIGSVETVRPEDVPKNLKRGEQVQLVAFNQMGTVINPPDGNEEVLVQVGILKTKVSLNQLKRVDTHKDVVKKYTVKPSAGPRTEAVSSEVDVRGQDLEEARMSVDKYIDEAYLSKLENVYIIHGKGTGVLRKGLREYLRSHVHVKSMRDGGYHEGGNGVTVVELK